MNFSRKNVPRTKADTPDNLDGNKCAASFRHSRTIGIKGFNFDKSPQSYLPSLPTPHRGLQEHPKTFRRPQNPLLPPTMGTPRRIALSPLVLGGLLGLTVIFGSRADAQPDPAFLTRAQFTAKIADYFGWPHPSDYNDIWKVPLKPLKDVQPADPFRKEIETAVEQGIISPDIEGYFHPSDPISRQDAAVVIAKVFHVAPLSEDVAARFQDGPKIKPAARESVSSLVAHGYMTGRSLERFEPAAPLSPSEADAIVDRITSTRVSPVQAMPLQNAIAPRRYIMLFCPTPGATIHFTTDGSPPTASSPIYTLETRGHINEQISDDQRPEREVVYKAIAVKDGLEASPVQTFTWHLYRPRHAQFQHLLIQAKTATSPAIYRICNDAESVRPMAWYIEGQTSGLLFDALLTSPSEGNLKEYIDQQIATVPYCVVIGHEHGDHSAQAPTFVRAGVKVYANERGWKMLSSPSGPMMAVTIPDKDVQAKILNVDEGDQFHLGGCDLQVYALPGHAHGLVILQDKKNGLIFATDFYGCTRAGSADNVGIMGVRADLMLSLVQQTYDSYLRDGGRIQKVFTGHDEVPLSDINLRLFEKAFQAVIDNGEAACGPTLRGNNDAPRSRTVLIGDMWKNGYQWIAVKLPGILGDSTPYLSSSPINYNGKDGYLKYSVLSNVQVLGGKLEGKTVTWEAPSGPFAWGNSMITIQNALHNKFDPWSYAYTIRVPRQAHAITLTATAMSTKIRSMNLNGRPIASRSPQTVAVSEGSSIAIDVVAPDGVTQSHYTFTVAPSDR